MSQIFKINIGQQTYNVLASSEDEAIDIAASMHEEPAAPAAPKPPVVAPVAPRPQVDFGSERPFREDEGPGSPAQAQMVDFMKWTTPAGSISNIGDALAGKPVSRLALGLSAADLATLGLAGKLRTGVNGATAGWRGVKQALAQGAAGGAAAWGAKEAGLPWQAQAALGLGTGAMAGRLAFPEATTVSRVPKGEEAQALTRTMRGLGMDIGTPASSKPFDVMSTFSAARDKAGKAVGAAKEAMWGNFKGSAKRMGEYVSKAGAESVLGSEIPVVNKKPMWQYTKNPESSKEVLGTIGKVRRVPSGAKPAQAAEMINSVVEGLQETVANSKRPGSPVRDLDSVAVAKVSEAMQQALDSLAPAKQLAVAKAADKAFSKLARVHEVAYPAAKGKVAGTPAFNPATAQTAWANMEPKVKTSTFSPDEIKALDFLFEQKEPGLIKRGAQALGRGWAGIKRDVYQEPIMSTPSARFTQGVKPSIVREVGQTAQPLALRSGAAKANSENDKKEAAKRRYQMMIEQVNAGGR